MFGLLEAKITGTQIAYYIVCKRKLWLFTRQIEMERFSELVEIGRLISEEAFKRENFKEISFGDTIKIDFLKVGDEIIVHEVKKSRKLEEAHIWQVKYYISILRQLGIRANLGVIHYPKLRKKLEVLFTEEDEDRIRKAIDEIRKIKKEKVLPPLSEKPYCKNCAHFEFCFA